jgi:hypothetical protein
MLVAGLEGAVSVTRADGIRGHAKDPPGLHRAGLGNREAAGYEM